MAVRAASCHGLANRPCEAQARSGGPCSRDGKNIAEFNAKQRENPTIDQCFLKVGQDIFNDDLAPFNKYMATLSEITLYKTLIEAQTRADLADEPQADSRRRRTY